MLADLGRDRSLADELIRQRRSEARADEARDLMLALAEQIGVPLSTLVCRAERLQDQDPPWRSLIVE
jgi:hypothetical protein